MNTSTRTVVEKDTPPAPASVDMRAARNAALDGSVQERTTLSALIGSDVLVEELVEVAINSATPLIEAAVRGQMVQEIQDLADTCHHTTSGRARPCGSLWRRGVQDAARVVAEAQL